jgi:hypothetical protein
MVRSGIPCNRDYDGIIVSLTGPHLLLKKERGDDSGSSSGDDSADEEKDFMDEEDTFRNFADRDDASPQTTPNDATPNDATPVQPVILHQLAECDTGRIVDPVEQGARLSSTPSPSPLC